MKSARNPSFPNWNTRQVALATFFVVAVGLAFWLLFRFRSVILILFASILIGMALQPMVQWLTRRGIVRNLSLAIVYLILILLIGSVIWVLVPLIVEQSSALIISLPDIYIQLRAALMKSNSSILQNFAWQMPSDMRLLMNNATQAPADLNAVENVLGIVGSLLKTILAAIAVFLLTSFWILDGARTIAGLLLYLPKRFRIPTEDVLGQIEKRVGAFLRGQFLLSLSIAILALISYLIIGLPNALVLALIAGIFEAVPIFGPALGAIPALLVAFSLNPTLVVWVLLATVVMQGLENYLLVPRIMGSAVGVNPVITLLLLATFSSLLGLPGALLAIPSAAILQLLLSRFVIDRQKETWKIEDGRDASSALNYELQELVMDIRKQIRHKEMRADSESDQLEDEIEAVALSVRVLLDHDRLESGS